MAIYRFHLINSHIDADDEQGQELPSLDAARKRAIAGIRGFLDGEIAKGLLDMHGRIDIEDEDGSVLSTVSFADAVSIRNY
jgi:hypothetical protein